VSRKISLLFLLSCFVGFFALNSTVKAAPPTNFQTTQIIGSDLDVTTGFEFAPDGRIFILERTGKVKIYKNGTLLPTPFAQLNSVATGDRGLTGIAFDPNFSSNHFVYFYYSDANGFNRLTRMDASSDIGTSETLMFQAPQASLELHIGGTICFGPDGKLYVSIGDNGLASNAQDLSNPFGKILRLNPDGTVPTDNPFVGQSGKMPAIWAYGFRNPFRFQFDSTTGRLYLGDVGNDTWEEVNLVTKGGNYGWPTCEGACSDPNFINPIYTYAHNGASSSITGGLVYHGNMFPSEFWGKYFFADYAKGFIKTLTLDSNGNFTAVSDFDLNASSVVDLKTAPDGSIYYITYIPARLYRITYSTFNQTPTAKASADKTTGQPPLTVNFSSSGSFDPEGTQLTYNWNFGDGTTSTSSNPTKIYNNKGRFTIQLTVSDGVNFAQAAPIVVQVGTPPTVLINTPIAGTTYKAGSTISYSASGTDSNNSVLPDNAFITNVVFHHDTHIHPFLGPIQSKSGQFTIPTSGEPSPNTYYEIMITGTDSDGLQTTTSLSIFPQKVNLTFSTNPLDLPILLDGALTNTIITLEHVIGFQRVLSAPVLQELSGNTYFFSSWSDNGGIFHTITAPPFPTTYTANYNLLPSFQAQFFNNTNLSGTPVLVRQDKKIDFEWGENSPAPGVNADNFSARWTNSVFFSAAKYRFITTSDDGVRLYIDNQLVIDKWIPQSATQYYADINLATGTHNIKLEYFDASFDAIAKLTWELLPSQNSLPSPTPTPAPSPSILPTPTSTPVFADYKGEYWNTPNLGSAPSIPTTTPNLTRNDIAINFNWGEGSPDTAINADHFVARWTKQFNFDNVTYRFSTLSDDGIRVYIDNQLILDKWVDQSAINFTVDKLMSAGPHEVKVEYYENAFDAVAQFNFVRVDTTPTPTPSPTPTITPSPTPSPQTQGLKGEYYDNIDLTNLKLTRVDPNVNFNWGSAAPNTLIGPDTFSVRWSGFVQPQFSQTYTFFTNTDDGVRLWVNDKLIIDKWVNQSTKEWSGSITLTAGQKYTIKMEYFNNTFDAVAVLRWRSPSQPKQIIPQSRLFTN
jgi:glucose/arabinose dehydrogenase